MLKLIFLLLALSIPAYATDINNCSLPDCLKLHAQLVARIKNLQGKNLPVAASAKSGGFGEIVTKNANSAKYCPKDDVEMGKICWMTQADASSYCASIGQRLPTLKEFVELAKASGATGIVTEADANNETKQFSHKLIEDIKFKNSDGTPSQLYYSLRGYKHPDGDLGLRSFWTSSEAIVKNETRSTHYVFYSDSGHLKKIFSNGVSPVRCISGR